jgi:DNA-binding response OmpR family regulator
MRILIVDDDPMVIKSCSRILEAEGHETLIAYTVKSGEDLLGERAFDLMITDIKMPGQDGFEMIRRSTLKRPGMPILVMTGYLVPDIVEQGHRLGVSHYIAKPFTPDELLTAIESIP